MGIEWWAPRRCEGERGGGGGGGGVWGIQVLQGYLWVRTGETRRLAGLRLRDRLRRRGGVLLRRRGGGLPRLPLRLRGVGDLHAFT